jgi:hypothetical protein
MVSKKILYKRAKIYPTIKPPMNPSILKIELFKIEVLY